MRNFVVVIPARFASTRFPGKALADLGGTSVLHRCFLQVQKVVPVADIYVATDDQRIVAECKTHGMQWVMTSSECLTGTDRVAEVAMGISAKWYINVQGDEPFLDPNGLLSVINSALASSSEVAVVNAYAPIDSEAEFRSATVPKVVATAAGKLLYISRAAIPTNKSLGFLGANRQVGLYAFRLPALAAFARVSTKTPIESVEDIEILRFLELGYEVSMVEVPRGGIAIDTPEDLVAARQYLARSSKSMT